MQHILNYIKESIKASPAKNYLDGNFSDSEIINNIFTILFGGKGNLRFAINFLEKSNVTKMVKWICEEYPYMNDYSITEIWTYWNNKDYLLDGLQNFSESDTKLLVGEDGVRKIRKERSNESERSFYGSGTSRNTCPLPDETKFSLAVYGNGDSISVRFETWDEIEKRIACTYIFLKREKDSRVNPEINQINDKNIKKFFNELQKFYDQFETILEDAFKKPEHKAKKMDSKDMIPGALYYTGSEVGIIKNKWKRYGGGEQVDYSRYFCYGVEGESSAVGKIKDFVENNTDLIKQLEKIYKKYSYIFDKDSIDILSRKNLTVRKIQSTRFNDAFKNYMLINHNLKYVQFGIISETGLSNSAYGYGISAENAKDGKTYGYNSFAQLLQ